MSSVLISGIAGFIGKYVASLLRERGYHVSGIAQYRHSPDEGVYRCNLLGRASLAGVLSEVKPDHVVHLAAIAFVAHGDADAMYRTNVVGTRNQLEAVASASHAPRSVLLANSASIYGNTVIDPLVESVSAAPADDYAVRKMAMEHVATLWSPLLPPMFVRPFNCSGFGQSLHFLLPKIVDHFRRGAKEIELGNVVVACNFSNVHTMREAIEILERIAGYTIEVKVNPAFVRQGEVRYLRGSNEKLQKQIGPLKAIPLEETLRWMYEA